MYFPPTDKPDKPTGPIVIEALLKNSVVISWKPPADDGGSWITNYVVEKCEAKEGAEWQLVSSAISVTTCRIVNLTENAGYYFRVSAQNTFGISEPLEVSSVVIIKSPFGEYNLYRQSSYSKIPSVCRPFFFKQMIFERRQQRLS